MMLHNQDEKPPLVRERRIDRAREVSNGLYIFEYSPDKAGPKNQKESSAASHRAQKSAAYYLKMEELKEKRKQLEGSGVGSDHKSNIERLRSLIKNGRSHTKASDSGIEKMMRALQKLMKTSSNIRMSFEAIKRYSMTASSHNMELFIQSRHLNLNDTVKIGNGYRSKEQKLMPINEHSDQNAMNADSFNYFKEISKHLTLPNDQKQQERERERERGQARERERQTSFSFRDGDTPHKQMKYLSRGYITTQQDLSMSAENSPGQRFMYEAQADPKELVHSRIKLNMPKLGFYGGIIESAIKAAPFSIQSVSSAVKTREPESKVQQNTQISPGNESDQIQLLFSQVAFIFTKKVSEATERRAGKPRSPIYDLFAFPTVNESIEEYHPSKTGNEHVLNHKNPSERKVNGSRRSSNVFRKSRREQIASNAQYANRMLFGEVQKEGAGENKLARNPLMQEQNIRQRVRSMPKITFTYTSREKYERQCSPEMKNSIFPITVYKKRQARQQQSSIKNSKGQLQTTISSKKASSRANPRFGAATQKNQDYHMNGVISPGRYQKVVVSPRQMDQYSMASSYNQAVPQGMSNDYYGTYANLRRFDQERERVITANPNMGTGVEFGGAEREISGCCLVKEVRSKSLNDRVVLFNYQNHYQS